MDSRPDEHRQAAHVFLDIISAASVSDPEGKLVELAFARMTEVAPVTRVTDESGKQMDDATTLVHGAVIVIQILMEAVRSSTGADELAVLQAVREEVDRV